MEFRLLAEDCESPSTSSLTLEGIQLSLTEPVDVSSDLPEYTCISYVWGFSRVPHPFTSTSKISDHTLPALAAAIRCHGSRRFWIDAFCVPQNHPEKRATLESMGFIYSRAKQVIAVLSRDTFTAFMRMSQSEQLDEQSLEILEQDEWIASVWTYQELVNSQSLFFVCEDPEYTNTVAGIDFLNRVGFFLELYRKAHGINFFDVQETFPRLCAFEESIADWLTAGYEERSALHVMSNMDCRLARDSKSRFYSMIGAITQEASPRSLYPSVADLSEAFMAACEKKNDFSFIFSATNRDILSGKPWRPIAGLLPAILRWHSWGEAQRAHESAEGLWIDDMDMLELSPVLGKEAKQIIQKLLSWTQWPDITNLAEKAIAGELYNTLRRMGFTGSQSYLVTEYGIFFPQHPILAMAGVTILVSASIRWTVGAPGLALVTAEGDILYAPGVFVGCVINSKASSVLLRNEPEKLDRS